MASEYQLPNGLLIILHLHLLNYPLQDATGYDERLFDSSRGMRDRNKAMEDITYFLLWKIEGSKERAKSILSTYPCLQPSDTTAFRIALSKYLEALRNAIAHTTHASEFKGKQPAHDEAPAWWWKDVVVRKTILDECSGDRFERLILALSSHAVLKNTARTSSLRLSGSSAKDREKDLDTLSGVYSIRLAAAQGVRLEWERAAAIFVQRQLDLKLIRARIADPKHAGSSKYESLETSRLLALRDSRHQDLIHGSWKGEDGSAVLRLMTQFAGLFDDSASVCTAPASQPDDTGVDLLTITQSQTVTEAPPPLPIAAAHHPAHLHALRASLFPKSKPSHHADPERADSSAESAPSPHAITERLIALDKVNASLQTALSKAQGIHTQLRHGLEKARNNAASQRSAQKVKDAASHLHLDLSLWGPRHGRLADFTSHDPFISQSSADESALARFGLAGPPSDNAIEDRISHLRTLLPPFTADLLPVSDSEPEAPPYQHASRLRPPSSRTQAPVISNSRGATGAIPSSKPRIASSTKQVRVAELPNAIRRPSASDLGIGGSSKANTTARRLSRRASVARTRRSTMFRRGSDADILRIVEAVQDRSDSEVEDDDGDEEHASGTRTPLRLTPARQTQGTRGMPLSSAKKSGLRQSFDIERFQRVNMPRLPGLHLGTPLEIDEEIEHGIEQGPQACAEDDDAYEGNSMTLAEILLQAGHQGNVSVQLLGEDELEDMSDWA